MDSEMMWITILNGFLKLLELLEKVTAFIDFLFTPIGLSILLSLISYHGLLSYQCDALTSAILASAIALTLHSIVQQPDP